MNKEEYLVELGALLQNQFNKINDELLKEYGGVAPHKEAMDALIWASFSKVLLHSLEGLHESKKRLDKLGWEEV